MGTDDIENYLRMVKKLRRPIEFSVLHFLCYHIHIITFPNDGADLRSVQVNRFQTEPGI